MKRITLISIVAAAFLAGAILSSGGLAQQDQTPRHQKAQLQVIVFAMNQIGFWEPATQKLHIYKRTGEYLGVYELEVLGKPLKISQPE